MHGEPITFCKWCMKRLRSMLASVFFPNVGLGGSGVREVGARLLEELVGDIPGGGAGSPGGGLCVRGCGWVWMGVSGWVCVCVWVCV